MHQRSPCDLDRLCAVGTSMGVQGLLWRHFVGTSIGSAGLFIGLVVSLVGSLHRFLPVRLCQLLQCVVRGNTTARQ